MSKEVLQKLFKKYNLEIGTDVLDGLKHLTTNLDKASGEMLAFYRIRNDQSLPLFKERLKESQSPLIIISNQSTEALDDQKRIFQVDEKEFEDFQNQLIEVFYPLKNVMKIIGVTGTNGKTTVVHLCRELSRVLGKKTLSIGTMGIIGEKGELLEDLYSTTPSKLDLRRVLHLYQDEYDAAFLEVSSHGLHQGRMKNIQLDGAGWTSFSQDHLDYHSSMEEYFQEKCKITGLLGEEAKLFVPSEEQELFGKIQKITKAEKTRSLSEWGERKLKETLKRSFNKKNMELALELVDKLWKIPENIFFEEVSPPLGRFTTLSNEKSTAIVDYAHTPDALENICQELKRVYPDAFFIVVFGCGGDRDPIKRPLMGKVAEEYSDLALVTSDNPRTEDPQKIIEDIKKGMRGEYLEEVDRKKAIIKALEYPPPENYNEKVILIAGKGHEEYQEINNVKHDFSDFKIIEDFWS